MADWCECGNRNNYHNVTTVHCVEGPDRNTIQCSTCQKHKNYCRCYGCDAFHEPLSVWHKTVNKYVVNGLPLLDAIIAARDELYPNGI